MYHFARYLDRQAYAKLLDTILDAHHDVDPVNTVKLALGELANVWPQTVAADPHSLPQCPCCGDRA